MKHLTLIVGVTTSLVTLLVVGGVIYLRSQPPPEAAPLLPQVRHVIDTAKGDAIASSTNGWSTFESKELGIKFSYPDAFGEVVVLPAVYPDCWKDDDTGMIPMRLQTKADQYVTFSAVGGDAADDSVYRSALLGMTITHHAPSDPVYCGVDLKEAASQLAHEPLEKKNPDIEMMARIYDMPVVEQEGGIRVYSSAFGIFGHGAPPTKMYMLVTPQSDRFDMIGVDARMSLTYEELDKASQLPVGSMSENTEVSYIKNSPDAKQQRAFFDDVQKMVDSIREYH